jgi:hypothetical protein
MGKEAGEEGVLGRLWGDGAAGVGGGDGTEREVDGEGGGCHGDDNDADADIDMRGVGRMPWPGRPPGVSCISGWGDWGFGVSLCAA